MSKKRYPIRVPRFAAGIRAQEGRGTGRVWWARRWTAVMEGIGLGARFGRGRNYAVSGQVTTLMITGPHVEATVVGSRESPYTVTVDFRAPEGESREHIISALKNDPMMVARLAADDLPTTVETLFRKEGLDLFPGGRIAPGKYDMTTKCSCPDYANPCKHSCAVLLLLGEEITRRPATLLELRGITIKELIDEN